LLLEVFDQGCLSARGIPVGSQFGDLLLEPFDQRRLPAGRIAFGSQFDNLLLQHFDAPGLSSQRIAFAAELTDLLPETLQFGEVSVFTRLRQFARPLVALPGALHGVLYSVGCFSRRFILCVHNGLTPVSGCRGVYSVIELHPDF